MSFGLFITIFLADLAAVMVHSAIQESKKPKEELPKVEAETN